MVVQPNSGVRELPSYIRIRTECLLHRNELSVWSFGPLGRRTLATSGTQEGHLVKIENATLHSPKIRVPDDHFNLTILSE